MRKILKLSILLGTIAAVALACTAEAQQTKTVLPAPFPAQITNGKKVFISNAGGDTNGLYSGEP